MRLAPCLAGQPLLGKEMSSYFQFVFTRKDIEVVSSTFWIPATCLAPICHCKAAWRHVRHGCHQEAKQVPSGKSGLPTDRLGYTWLCRREDAAEKRIECRWGWGGSHHTAEGFMDRRDVKSKGFSRLWEMRASWRKKDRSIVPGTDTCLRTRAHGVELSVIVPGKVLLSPADTCTVPGTTSIWTSLHPSSSEHCPSSSRTRSSSGCMARPPSSISGTGSSPTRYVVCPGRDWGGWMICEGQASLPHWGLAQRKARAALTWSSGSPQSDERCGPPWGARSLMGEAVHPREPQVPSDGRGCPPWEAPSLTGEAVHSAESPRPVWWERQYTLGSFQSEEGDTSLPIERVLFDSGEWFLETDLGLNCSSLTRLQAWVIYFSELQFSHPYGEN